MSPQYQPSEGPRKANEQISPLRCISRVHPPPKDIQLEHLSEIASAITALSSSEAYERLLREEVPKYTRLINGKHGEAIQVIESQRIREFDAPFGVPSKEVTHFLHKHLANPHDFLPIVELSQHLDARLHRARALIQLTKYEECSTELEQVRRGYKTLHRSDFLNEHDLDLEENHLAMECLQTCSRAMLEVSLGKRSHARNLVNRGIDAALQQFGTETCILSRDFLLLQQLQDRANDSREPLIGSVRSPTLPSLSLSSMLEDWPYSVVAPEVKMPPFGEDSNGLMLKRTIDGIAWHYLQDHPRGPHASQRSVLREWDYLGARIRHQQTLPRGVATALLIEEEEFAQRMLTEIDARMPEAARRDFEVAKAVLLFVTKYGETDQCSEAFERFLLLSLKFFEHVEDLPDLVAAKAASAEWHELSYNFLAKVQVEVMSGVYNLKQSVKEEALATIEELAKEVRKMREVDL